MVARIVGAALAVALALLPVEAYERTLLTASAHVHRNVESWKTMVVHVTAYVTNVSQRGSGCYVNTGSTGLYGSVPHVGTVAVDPSVFRKGTRFRIPGYGAGRAEDTGDYIRGRHIDIVEPTCASAMRWGTRLLKVEYR